MIRTSEIRTTAPEAFVNETQRLVYAALERMGIPFGRIDNDPAVTMEDCIAIDKAAVEPEAVGFPDGTTTCYMRMRTADLLDRFIPETGHEPTFI